jgi:hypothetical protein
MIYGKVVGPSKYQVIDIMQLPDSVSDALECPGNDKAEIINPEFHPLLRTWLAENGHDTETCYIAWWSW